MSVITSFKELTGEQEPLAGGKGRTLARLYRAGYRVPDGFIILPAAFAGDELTHGSVGAGADTSRPPAESTIRDGAFAVRSSALSEDSAQASFAGEFETVLDVRTDEEIRQAIHTVRRSRHNARVQAYSQAQGLEADGARNRRRRPAPDPGGFLRRAVHRRPGDGRPDADDGQFRARPGREDWSPGRPIRRPLHWLARREPTAGRRNSTALRATSIATPAGWRKNWAARKTSNGRLRADGCTSSNRAPSPPWADTKPIPANGTTVSRATFYGPAPTWSKTRLTC